jgi:DNA transformation protein
MIKNLRNLGPQSAKMLRKAGIVSNNELRSLGSIAAYLAVKRVGCSPSINLLWALEGALTDRDWKEVARKDRLSLLIQLEDAEKRGK